MSEDGTRWTRRGKVFWRSQHESWARSDLNQREYCEVPPIPLKAFGVWRAKFKASPQPPARKPLVSIHARWYGTALMGFMRSAAGPSL